MDQTQSVGLKGGFLIRIPILHQTGNTWWMAKFRNCRISLLLASADHTVHETIRSRSLPLPQISKNIEHMDGCRQDK
jgi:hypothetical protein